MVNSEHLQILEKGTEAWNQWRKDNPTVSPDLQGANLSGKDCCEINLSGANLNQANLSRTFIRWANLSRAKLIGAQLTGTDLSGTNLEHVNLSQANLQGATMRWVDLSFANLTQANLQGATLSGSNLCHSTLAETDFRRAEFRWADMRGADLLEADLTWADLRGADLRSAALESTIAISADFTQAIFTEACLQNWEISIDTKLDDIECLHIYLQADQQDRHPPEGDFTADEFRKLVQPKLATLDLIYMDGINWLAFLTAFQSLCTEFEQNEIEIRDVEKKHGGTYSIRLKVDKHSDLENIEAFLKQAYDQQLLAASQV